MPAPPDTTFEISPLETADWTKSNPSSFVLVDCREQDEWDLCRIEGARLIPLSQFAHLAPAQLDPATPIVVYCHHGMRSAKAAEWLRQKGFRAWSLAGGIDVWSQEIDSAVSRY